MRIITVPTASGKHAVQVVSKRFGVLTVHKHIGSYATAEEKLRLCQKARSFIQDDSRQTNLLEWLSSVRPANIAITQSQPLFVYRLLSGVYRKLGFDRYPDPVIQDLIIARVYAPASKREIREILAECFDRRWSLITIYRHLKTALASNLKDTFQQALIRFAGDELKDNLRLVFYDVTTLYFETAAKVGLKNFGFSKDHRPQDAQVVVGLVVNRRGFPVYFDVFSGRDGKITTVGYRGQRLICQYLSRRAAKDKADREKQVARAKKAILDSAAITGRYRFVKAAGNKYSLNRNLITKAERLQGIKGYLTNTKLPRLTVINRYHDLWQIENAFRLTKSDLEARLVFHRLDETIKVHLLIVFAGLAISRYLEINTGMSIKRILKLAEKVLTHKVTNRQTGETGYIETTIEDQDLKAKINLLKSLGH